MGTGTGNEGTISEIDIRIFIRDNDPEQNVLIDDFEFTPEEIRTATTLAIDKWNDTPPEVVNYSIDNFPWRYYFLMQTAANLLNIAGFRYQRNDLSYQVPGGAINDQNKALPYFSKATELSKEFNELMRLKKNEIQVSLGWATI